MTTSSPGSSPAPVAAGGRWTSREGDPLARYVLTLGDDSLIAAQRMSEWITRAPQLEEDVALANLALDLLGQARSLLAYAGRLLQEATGEPCDEDTLAYFRDGRDFRNVHLVERENGDFAVTTARLLILSAYSYELYSLLSASADPTLGAVAAKAVKEVAYCRDHATMWLLRLGDGTATSAARMQAGLDAEWPYVEELFDGAHIDPALLESGVAVDPARLRPGWQRYVDEAVARARLVVPDARPAVTGGRRGLHTEQMGYLLAEMQHLARSHPGATW